MKRSRTRGSRRRRRRLGPRPYDRDKAGPGPRMRSGERAEPPMTKARSAALSARSDGLDDINGGPECGVYTQMRGVEQVRVGRGLERRGGAPRNRARRAAAGRPGPRPRRPARPAPRSSRTRRAARTSGVATTNSFTSAPGAITVPISRPSSTAPGGAWRIRADNSSEPDAPPESPRPPRRPR